MSSLSPARNAAFSILMKLERERGHSDELLRGKSVDALAEVDRKLTTALVLGVLRWQVDLDRCIYPLLKHPNAKLDAEVLIALRLAAFQLLHMDRIPARAAIDESVELAKQAGHRFASGMVNAVLRKLAAAIAERKNPEAERSGAYPAWMVERWKGAYGDEGTCQICSYGQKQPILSVRLSGEVVGTELVDAGIVLGPGQLLNAARQVVAGDVTKTAAFQDERVRIQDEGSQLIAELTPRGRRILDCCAAPGGKTLIIAERNLDAEIVACDGSLQRLSELRKRLAGLGERVQCRLADGVRHGDEPEFDVALVDVPCSGTGTLGRNPEIRHRLKLEDLSRQADRQKAILRSAFRAVRPGGYVLYSTCSLEPEENEEVVAAVMAETSEARVVSLANRIEELRSEAILTGPGTAGLMGCITSEGYLRIMPGEFQTDGFFAALMRRTLV